MKKYIALSLLVGSFMVPSVGFAQMLSLEEQIRNLQSQVVALQNMLKEREAPTRDLKVWCNTFRTNLQLGDQSPDAFALSITLSKENLGTGLLEGRTVFDQQVLTAVKQFQKKYGIPTTGFVGPMTRAKLNSLYQCDKI